jgi:hypothetical protein
MNQQNYFIFQNDDGRNQKIRNGLRELQKVGEIIDITFQNHLENLKDSFKYFNNNERQKLTRIVGAQAQMMIYALKSGLSFYFKDVSIGGITILDVYVDDKEYEQCIKNLILRYITNNYFFSIFN